MNKAARAALDALRAQARKASIAEIGGFHQPDDPRASWFGGNGVGLPGESLPIHAGREMFPLLQINVAELPYVPPELAGITLLILFMNREKLPFDHLHGDGWLIREYAANDHLVPLPAPTEPPMVRPFPIRWRLDADETPGWEDAWSVVDLSAVNEDDEASDMFFDIMHNHAGTKVGGFPTEIQHGAGLENYVFQVGSEEKPRWMWADNGVAHFFRENGSWRFTCQFY